MTEAPTGRSMPTFEAIAEYWAGRCLLHDSPEGNCDCVGGGFMLADGPRVFSDPGWVYCPGCGILIASTRHDTRVRQKERILASIDKFVDRYIASQEALTAFATRLHNLPERRIIGERAHIIPKALGGSDKPFNIIPLCSDCHNANPEQESRRVYLDWLIARREESNAIALDFLRLTDGGERWHKMWRAALAA